MQGLVICFLISSAAFGSMGGDTCPQSLSNARSRIESSPSGQSLAPVALRFDAEAIPSYVSGLPGERLPLVAATDPHAGRWDEPVESEKGGRSYLPVLYSLIVPGAGELALGHYWRGAALLALEVTAWTGYAVYHEKGLDGREEFEAFADTYWDHDRWLYDHNTRQHLVDTGQLDPNAGPSEIFTAIDEFGRSGQWQGFPGWHSYAAKEDEKQNYYENIGKYDWFISGWADWADTGKGENTPLRDQYRDLRKQSNDDLDKADQFIYLSIATRVFSLVETWVLVRRSNSEAATGALQPDDRTYRVTARSTGPYSGEIAFEYRFR